MSTTTIGNTTTNNPGKVDPRVAALVREQLPVHLPGSATYAELAAPFNLAVAVQPLAVVEAHDSTDVARTVTLAGRHHLPVAVQATGHGATSTLAEAVLVSTRRLGELVVHAEERWVRVGAGVCWSDVLKAAAPYGLAPLAGSAPGVGVVGYTTGGGLGPVARTYGLASDRVRAFDVVTGDGVLRRATATEFPDLFWALRGGKGVAGIVTAVEFDLLPIAELYAGALYFDGADAQAVAQAWAAWSATLPVEATTSIAFLRLPPLPQVPPPLAGRLTIAVRFAWTGDFERGAEVLAPMRSVATPIIDGVAPMPYAALGAIHADPVDPMPVHEEHGLLRELPAAAVDRLVELVGPEAECPQVIVEVRQLGGALASTSARESAFDHRDAAFSLFTIGLGVPPVVEAVAAHGAQLLQELQAWTTGTQLPNFAARADADWFTKVYAPDTLARLARVRATYDPAGVLVAGRGLPAPRPRRGLRALLTRR